MMRPIFHANPLLLLTFHSSEIRGLCLMKWPGETLQNLPYFMIMKTQSCFFHFVQLYFFINECPGLCWHKPGHSLDKKQSSVKWKTEKATLGYRIHKYIKYDKFWSVSLNHFIKHKHKFLKHEFNHKKILQINFSHQKKFHCRK